MYSHSENFVIIVYTDSKLSVLAHAPLEFKEPGFLNVLQSPADAAHPHIMVC